MSLRQVMIVQELVKEEHEQQMPETQIKSAGELLGIQGWKIASGGITLRGGAVHLHLERESGAGRVCGKCGQGVLFLYDHLEERQVRDFPVWGLRCYLHLRAARVDCPTCGVQREKLEWIEGYQRMTLRYEMYVARLCGLLPGLDVAEWEGLDKETVYRLDRKWLARREKLREARPVRHLGMDEIALRRGHKYATVFYDLERKEVIGLVQGRSQRKASRFFRRWGKANCKAVEAVCMDLWAAYRNSVRLHCRKALIVFDKFHVYTYLSQAIEETRRQEQNQADKAGQKLLKGSRWLWLRRADKLKRKEKTTLDEIMAANANLQKAYLLKEDFEQFYQCEHRAEAAAFLAEWTRRCNESALKPFKQLAKRLNRWAGGILAYFTTRLTNAVSEGLNNKIKVLKRRAYGFHDMDYFFLKILNITGALPSLDSLTHNF